jgi:hypothetical protein
VFLNTSCIVVDVNPAYDMGRIRSHSVKFFTSRFLAWAFLALCGLNFCCQRRISFLHSGRQGYCPRDLICSQCTTTRSSPISSTYTRGAIPGARTTDANRYKPMAASTLFSFGPIRWYIGPTPHSITTQYFLSGHSPGKAIDAGSRHGPRPHKVFRSGPRATFGSHTSSPSPLPISP